MFKKRILSALTAAVTAFSAVSAMPVHGDGFEPVFCGVIPVSEYPLSAVRVNAVSADEAVAYIRDRLKNRVYEFNVSIPSGGWSDGKTAALDILARAFYETENCDEGDYLRFALKSYRYGYEESWGQYTAYYRMTYYSTSEDEQAVEKAAEKVLADLALDGKSDYEKIRSIYDFVSENAVYSEDIERSSRIFTAYGALIEKECVCQGYSLLLYRLLKSVGVDCRIISGISNGERHTWNMVKLGSRYYLLDPTWDAELGGINGSFFLRGSADFDKTGDINKHIPVYEYEDIFPDYNSADFKLKYPQAQKRFIFGDANNNGIVDGNDATYTLSCYAAMSVDNSNFTMPTDHAAAADITGDCIVDGKDASLLLSYYAAASAGYSGSPDKFVHDR